MHRKRNLKHRMDSGCDHYDDDDVDLFCALRVTTTAVGSMTPKMPTQVGHPDIFLFAESDQIVKIVTEKQRGQNSYLPHARPPPHSHGTERSESMS